MVVSAVPFSKVMSSPSASVKIMAELPEAVATTPVVPEMSFMASTIAVTLVAPMVAAPVAVPLIVKLWLPEPVTTILASVLAVAVTPVLPVSTLIAAATVLAES